MKYIVANWKAHFDLTEAYHWLHTFAALPLEQLEGGVEVILCPPYPLLSIVNDILYDPFIKLGSQDVSQYEPGAHTGEVTAKTLSGIVDYAIVGHSERRSQYSESNEVIAAKCDRALAEHINPIICVRGSQDVIPKNCTFVAFEPIEAIGTSNNMPIADVLITKQNLHLSDTHVFLYGGSVTSQNAQEYLQSDKIDGVLVGSASLNPKELFAIALATKR